MYPLVSVIVPTCNSALFLEACLASIRQQTYPSLELIVVDEYSTDRTLEIAKRYAHAVYSGGPERSIKRNIGIEKAHGEYVLVIDSDMELTSEVVVQCVALAVQNTYRGIAIPEISVGEGFWAECIAFDRSMRLSANAVDISEAVRFFRREYALSVGGYDPTIVGAEDWDLHNKIAMQGSVGKVEAPIYHHEGQVSLYKRVRKKYYYSQAFRRYLRRYPTRGFLQFSPFKLSYLRAWRSLIAHPIVTCGLIIMKGGETTAGVLGLIFQNSKKV